MASDAFFPFDDGPKLLIDAGVRCLVHPGGSKRDEDTLTTLAARLSRSARLPTLNAKPRKAGSPRWVT